MAAGTWTFYESFREYLGDGTIDLDTHAFKVGLVTNAYTPNVSTHSAWSDASASEVSNAGYTATGYTITATWIRSGASVVFDSDDPNWTASGADLIAKYAILYDDTVTTPVIDALVAYVDLDTGNGTGVTATDGNPLTIQLPAGGFFNQA